jgi:hypothetical protein
MTLICCRADLGFALGHNLGDQDAVDELGFVLQCSAMPSRSISFAAMMPLTPVHSQGLTFGQIGVSIVSRVSSPVSNSRIRPGSAIRSHRAYH